MATVTERQVNIINTNSWGCIQLAVIRVFEEDGVRIAESEPHRRVIEPGDDVSEESADVQSVAAAVWTPEVLASWQNRPTDP